MGFLSSSSLAGTRSLVQAEFNADLPLFAEHPEDFAIQSRFLSSMSSNSPFLATFTVNRFQKLVAMQNMQSLAGPRVQTNCHLSSCRSCSSENILDLRDSDHGVRKPT